MRWRHFLILFILGCLWGGVTNLGKFAAHQGVPALTYAFYTIFVAGLGLLVVNFARRQRIPISSKHLTFYLLSGLFSNALPLGVMYTVLAHIPAGIMSIILAFVPMFTYVLALLVGIETGKLNRFLGIGLGFIGAVLILVSGGGVSGGVPVIWVFIAFLTPLGYAIGTIINHKFRPTGLDSIVQANCMLLNSALLLFIAMFATNNLYWPSAFGQQLIIVMLFHAALTGITFSLFFLLLREIGPVFVSQVGYIVTLSGIAIGMIAFDERFGMVFVLSLMLILAGLYMVNRGGPQTTSVVVKDD